ncbi:hypothetical protein R1sor_007359 [Riccia sorocarpa]|uniref:Endonuclease/exonuclease/phosphatase domain-containing protein n=1 Tax=Riccia sorocarpa TaxID=122646 RepID=A0ABD3HQ78_9MARC
MVEARDGSSRTDILVARDMSSSLRIAKWMESIHGLVLGVVGVKEEVAELRMDLQKIQKQGELSRAATALQLHVLTEMIAELKTSLPKTWEEQRKEMTTEYISQVGRVKSDQKTVVSLAADVMKNVCKIQEEQTEASQVLANLDVKMSALMVEVNSRVAGMAKDMEQIKQQKMEVMPNLDSAIGTIDEKFRSYADILMQRVPSAAQVPTTLDELAELDSRFHTYAVQSREAHTTILQEREREYEDREAQSKNLRIVGLSEESDEDTLAVVLSFFTNDLQARDGQVEQAIRVGRTDKGARVILVKFSSVKAKNEVLIVKGGADLWRKVDIIALVETWEYVAKKEYEIPGFSRVGSIKNSKRGFIRVLGRSYFAPYGSPVYSSLGEHDNLLAGISQVVLELCDKGPVWVVGDFNGRIGADQSFEVSEIERAQWRKEEGEICQWDRESNDEGRNRFSQALLQFSSVCNLTIMNGTPRFRHTKDFTCFTPNGQSVVDFLLASSAAREWISAFDFGPILPESDHRPLLFSIEGFGGRKNQTQHKKLMRLSFETGKRHEYKLKITERISRAPRTHEGVVNTLQEVARDTFGGGHRKLLLAEELIKEPRAFWDRLRPRRELCTLPTEELSQYVNTLYFYPNARLMPMVVSSDCVFSEADVSREVGNMKAGRAADLDGLSLELLKWGGAALNSVLTELINQAGQRGLPEAWT